MVGNGQEEGRFDTSHWSKFIENFAKKLTPPLAPYPSSKMSDSDQILEERLRCKLNPIDPIFRGFDTTCHI